MHYLQGIITVATGPYADAGATLVWCRTCACNKDGKYWRKHYKIRLFQRYY